VSQLFIQQPGIIDTGVLDAKAGRRVFFRVGFEQIALSIESERLKRTDPVRNENPIHA
jgi:hypothetical protein